MKSEPYFKMAFSLFIGMLWISFSAIALCGEPTSGKIFQLSDKDRENLKILGESVVGKAMPARPVVSIKDLMPLMNGEWVYRITAGKDRGDEQTDSIGRSKNENAKKPWRRMVGKKYIEYFRAKKDGKLIVVSEADLTENVITHYDPPVMVMYDGLKPGETIDQEIKITVYDLDDPTDEKYSGKLHVTHSYVGAFEVSVPAGKYETVLLKSTFVGKVGPASVKDFGYLFFSKNYGVVASVERMHVGAFLFYNKTTRTPKVLLRKSP